MTIMQLYRQAYADGCIEDHPKDWSCVQRLRTYDDNTEYSAAMSALISVDE